VGVGALAVLLGAFSLVYLRRFSGADASD
jgi:hypothetical protein